MKIRLAAIVIMKIRLAAIVIMKTRLAAIVIMKIRLADQGPEQSLDGAEWRQGFEVK